ncbi:MAG: YrbL family protein [Pseudomonadota bacterium]
MLVLSDKPIIAKGKNQYVYEHPHNPSRLVKVPQPHAFDAEGHKPNTKGIARRFRPATMYKGFLREFRQYLELKSRRQEPDDVLPICEVHGTTPTDIGLGLVYERVADPDGALPPSLGEMIKTERLEPWHLPILNAFFDDLIENHVMISNDNLDNVIFQTYGPRQGRFVWIDSFGCKQAIPLKKWSKQLNARSLNRYRAFFVNQAEAALNVQKTGADAVLKA